MATEIYILRETFQIGRSWENVGIDRSSWGNVGAHQFICYFLRFYDMNPQFTSMAIANLITSPGPDGSFHRRGLCYFMSSSWGMLSLFVQPTGNVVTGPCKSLEYSVKHCRESYQSVHCCSMSFKFRERYDCHSLTRKQSFIDMKDRLYIPSLPQ